MLGQPPPKDQTEAVTAAEQLAGLAQPCPCCGGPMIIIETFEAGQATGRSSDSPYQGEQVEHFSGEEDQAAGLADG